ncbi:MAG: polysaccharide biosynthesis C-terminal domain-containing protein, partial [Nitrosopumilus sp.]|nr:polysaccharide biosynthesis C-terminal domain-containing protein [Nitrosopumilus sp.]
LKASFNIQFFSTLGITFLFYILAYPLAYLLNDLSLIPYIQITSLILPFYAIFTLYTGYYNGLRNFKKQASLNIVYSLSKLVLVVGLVYVFHLYGAIIGFIVSPIIALLFGFKLPKAVKIDKALYRSLILFSLPLIGFAILSTLQLSIDLFFIKSLLMDNQAAGLYTASQNIARIPYYTLSAFALILLPTVSRSIHTESVAETGRRIRENLRYLLLLLIPGTVLIAITSPKLLQLLYSTSYIPAAESLTWLVIGLGFLTVFAVLANIIIADDKPGSAMSIAGAGVILISIFSWILIPRYGLVGASYATLIGGSFAMLTSLILVAKRFPNIINWLSTIKIILACAGIYIVHTFINFPAILLPITYIILGLVYGLILVVLGEITSKDINVIKQMIPKRAQFITPNE